MTAVRAPRLWGWLLAAALGSGCSSNVAAPQAPAVQPARKAAVAKMIRAVERAGRSDAREETIRMLREAVAEDPELWEARYDLGVMLARVGELDAARQELDKAHELAPNAEDVAVALAEVHRRLEHPALATEILAAFVKQYPAASHARRVLVAALREAGQAEAAALHARELLAQRPGDAQALAELALSHLEQGQVDVADLLVREALKADEPPAVVERAAGLIALERGEDAVAFAHFAKATELDPKDTAAGLNTATVLLQAGVFDRAEKHFRAVLDVAPDSDAAKLGLAAALRGQGSRNQPRPYVEAEALLKEILAASPGHWAAAHNLAVLYAESMARPADAASLYSQFLTHAPEGHPARSRAQKWVDEHAAPKGETIPRAQQ